MQLCEHWYTDEAALRLYTKIFSKRGELISTLGEAKEAVKNEQDLEMKDIMKLTHSNAATQKTLNNVEAATQSFNI